LCDRYRSTDSLIYAQWAHRYRRRWALEECLLVCPVGHLRVSVLRVCPLACPSLHHLALVGHLQGKLCRFGHIQFRLLTFPEPLASSHLPNDTSMINKKRRFRGPCYFSHDAICMTFASLTCDAVSRKANRQGECYFFNDGRLTEVFFFLLWSPAMAGFSCAPSTLSLHFCANPFCMSSDVPPLNCFFVYPSHSDPQICGTVHTH
jgi:hypothetical protein